MLWVALAFTPNTRHLGNQVNCLMETQLELRAAKMELVKLGACLRTLLGFFKRASSSCLLALSRESQAYRRAAHWHRPMNGHSFCLNAQSYHYMQWAFTTPIVFSCTLFFSDPHAQVEGDKNVWDHILARIYPLKGDRIPNLDPYDVLAVTPIAHMYNFESVMEDCIKAATMSLDHRDIYGHNSTYWGFSAPISFIELASKLQVRHTIINMITIRLR